MPASAAAPDATTSATKSSVRPSSVFGNQSKRGNLISHAARGANFDRAGLQFLAQARDVLFDRVRARLVAIAEQLVQQFLFREDALRTAGEDFEQGEFLPRERKRFAVEF